MASRRIREGSTSDDRKAIEGRGQARPEPRAVSRIGDGDLDRLLAGEDIDRSGLSYDLEACHLGLIADGDRVDDLLHRLASELGCGVLEAGAGAVSAWLGSPRSFGPEEIATICAAASGRDGALALGEPTSGLDGWRVTHRQARAAFALAAPGPRRVTRYGEVALLAAVLDDPGLTELLEQTYLAPLYTPKHRSRELPATIRAYVDARCDSSAAAAALAASRETVTGRIGLVEELIGRPLSGCLAELELALRLDRLSCMSSESEDPGSSPATSRHLAGRRPLPGSAPGR